MGKADYVKTVFSGENDGSTTVVSNRIMAMRKWLLAVLTSLANFLNRQQSDGWHVSVSCAAVYHSISHDVQEAAALQSVRLPLELNSCSLWQSFGYVDNASPVGLGSPVLTTQKADFA